MPPENSPKSGRAQCAKSDFLNIEVGPSPVDQIKRQLAGRDALVVTNPKGFGRSRNGAW